MSEQASSAGHQTAGLNNGAEYLVAIPIPDPPQNPSSSVTPKTLWMGDLEPWWDESFITELWASLNKTVQVKAIRPKRNSALQQLSSQTGTGLMNHSGYCFVEFETSDDAKDALRLNGSLVPSAGNKVFRLNWASGATLNSQVPQTPEYSLFVGDLSPSTTEAHLLSLFQTNYKSVKTVRVMTDPATGSSRCFGFVRFTDEQERARALNDMNQVWLGGRPIRVALATPRHQQNSNQWFPSFPRGAAPTVMDPVESQIPSGPNQFFAPHPLAGPTYYPPPQFNPSQHVQHQAFNDPNNTTVFVGGLQGGVPEETLVTLFEPFGSIVHVKIPPGKGCGFVKFSKREEAEQAIAGMQGFVIGGSRVRLSWGRSSNQHAQPPINQQMLLRNGMGLPGGIEASAFGIPPSIPSSIPNMAPQAPMYYDPYAESAVLAQNNGFGGGFNSGMSSGLEDRFLGDQTFTGGSNPE